MNSSTPISIVVVSDDHFMIMLAALLKSIETHHKTSELLHFYIVADKVSASAKKKLFNSFSNEKVKFEWIELKDAIPKGMNLPLDKSTYPLNIYMRLFMPYFLPQTVDKAIYLDVDMLAMEDIGKLWNIDIQDYLCAAVQDSSVPTVSNSWGGIVNYKELGLHPDTKYFNSGMMVFNLKKWREHNITQAVLKCIEDNVKFANYPDQYALNVVLADKWLPLDEKWNYFATGDLMYPYIIHFVRRKPFYTTYCFNTDYQRRFYDFVNATAWKGAKPISETRRYIKKFRNVIGKIKKMIS